MNQIKSKNTLEEYKRLGKIYPGIVAWGKLMRTRVAFVTKQLTMAENEKMARDVIHLNRRQGKITFQLFKDVVKPIRAQLYQLADDPDGVLKEGE